LKSFIILLPIFFPFVLSIIIASANFKPKTRDIVSSTGIILNFLILIFVFAVYGESKVQLFEINNFLNIYFNIDKLGILFSLLVSVLWIFTTFYSMQYMKHEGKEKRFFIFFTMTLGVTLGIAFSGNLITLYVFYEFLTLVTFPLVIHADSLEALKSGKKYLIYSFGGATLILLGMLILFSLTNDTTFVPLGSISGVLEGDMHLYLISYISMFIGFGVKAALVPFHSWLPSAMVAPTPVSALLHAVAVVKSGIFALVRTIYFVFGAEIVMKLNINAVLSVLIVISIIMGSFLALHQSNLKKRLAYSTISQLGYILLGLIIIDKEALMGGLLHLINHAVLKITLFFCVGAIIYNTHKTDISQIRGIGRQMPVTMGCFTVAAISLIGIPPTNGFVSKWYLAQGGLNIGKWIFPATLLLSALLTSLYLLPIITEAFFKKDSDGKVVVKEAPMKMLVPIVLITLIVIYLGLFPNALINFIEKISSDLI
jgi:multicomponent Na+:H+ antiporter subunit D